MKKVTVSPLEVVKLSTGLNWYCFYASSHIPNDFVCLFLFVWSLLSHSRNFSIIWRRHHCRWRAANFDLCSALMAIEQWGFFSMPHPLRQGPNVYNGHLRGPVTLAPVASGAVTTSIYDLGLSRPEIETRFLACQANALPLRHRGGPHDFVIRVELYNTYCKQYMLTIIKGTIRINEWTVLPLKK